MGKVCLFLLPLLLLSGSLALSSAALSDWLRSANGGTKCLHSGECTADQFCSFKAGGGCTAPGACKTRPTTCLERSSPVCGCNGKTYDNLCLAQVEGMSVRFEGPCEHMSVKDKGEAGKEEEEEAQDGPTRRDLRGRQGNPFLLQAKQAQPTAPAATTCGGAANVTCTGQQYCDFAEGGCGLAGQTGTCSTKPFICPAVYQPVCGCDGKTYSNTCYAQALGMPIKDAQHACPGTDPDDVPT